VSDRKRVQHNFLSLVTSISAYKRSSQVCGPEYARANQVTGPYISCYDAVPLSVWLWLLKRCSAPTSNKPVYPAHKEHSKGSPSALASGENLLTVPFRNGCFVYLHEFTQYEPGGWFVPVPLLLQRVGFDSV
jgi:hypothetical protein